MRCDTPFPAYGSGCRDGNCKVAGERRAQREAVGWLLGIEHSCIERVVFDEEERLPIAHVRPSRTRRGRLPLGCRPCALSR